MNIVVMSHNETAFDVEIQARDHLQEGDAKNLTVNVLWSNQPPLFNPSTFTVHIPEKTRVSPAFIFTSCS